MPTLHSLSTRGRETRQRMINAAKDLFHARGVRGTSPDDVLKASGTGKSQFYHYFGSKQGLVVAVLEQYLEEIRGGTAPLSYEFHNLDDLEGWFRAQLGLQQAFDMERGCPFGTIGGDLSSEQEPVRSALAAIFAEIRERLLAFFNAQRANGRLNPLADPEALADYCITTIQGAMLLGKIEQDSRAVEHTIAMATRHLRGFFLGNPI